MAGFGERASETLTTWTAVAALLRKNCLHEVADYMVVNVAFRNKRQFRPIVFWETSRYRALIEPDAMRALEQVPHAILAGMSATGRMSKIPRMLASAIEAAGNPFVRGCVDYFNAQSELRQGQSFTSVQREAVSEMCTCFHDEASAKGYLADKPNFTEIMAGLIDFNKMFSATNMGIASVLGRCAALHGQNLK